MPHTIRKSKLSPNKKVLKLFPKVYPEGLNEKRKQNEAPS